MVNESQVKDPRSWAKWNDAGAVGLAKLPECDSEIFYKGDHIANIIILNPTGIEKVVRLAARRSGQRMDWHYAGGVACVKALGDVEKATSSLKRILKDYEDKCGYWFTSNAA
jgi:hypothetical protein